MAIQTKTLLIKKNQYLIERVTGVDAPHQTIDLLTTVTNHPGVIDNQFIKVKQQSFVSKGRKKYMTIYYRFPFENSVIIKLWNWLIGKKYSPIVTT